MQPDPTDERVRELVRVLPEFSSLYAEEEEQAANELYALGRKAYPELARIIRGRDSKMEQFYDKVRVNLPAPLRKLFPKRTSRNELQRRAAGLLDYFGVVAIRDFTGTVSEALKHTTSVTGQILLRTLYWSIPDSPESINTLSNWLAHPRTDKLLFGMTAAGELWPKLPQMAPLLVDWLKIPDTASNAAGALGALGTNAAAAIPLLIETAEQGVAGQPPNLKWAIPYVSGIAVQMNKRAALVALGSIGIASPEVLATLGRAMTNTDDGFRVAGFSAAGLLGSKAVSLLPNLMASLTNANELVLPYQLEAIGKMGTTAQEAVPLLLRYSEAAAEPATPHRPRSVPWQHALDIPRASAIALFRVAPEKAISRAVTIARWLQAERKPANVVDSFRPLANSLVPVLEPLLATNGIHSHVAAYKILRLAPGHSAARETLLKHLDSTTGPVPQSIAALYLWWAIGNTELTLPILEKELESTNTMKQSLAVVAAENIGPDAKALIPALQSLLSHSSWRMRHSAARALRQIDPKALPPVNQKPL